jgi:A/G-specific adenine glycosylase
MLQQTTVATVRDYFAEFITRWPTIIDLAQAKDTDVMAAWAGLGYYARARNLLKASRIVAFEKGGYFPDDAQALQDLPGIGPYTSAAIAAIAFDQRASVLDGNVERVMARFHLIEAPLPGSKETLRNLADGMVPDVRFGDYAQGIMDLGATICTPRNPSCGMCPWAQGCKALAKNVAQDLPKKTAKPKKPTRYGTCFVVLRTDGAILLERRPDKGLLGGMLGWPGGGWTDQMQITEPPFEADWHEVPEEVRHTFTHFHLKLRVQRTSVDVGFNQTVGQFIMLDMFDANDLPTVMRKVWKLALPTV